MFIKKFIQAVFNFLHMNVLGYKYKYKSLALEELYKNCRETNIKLNKEILKCNNLYNIKQNLIKSSDTGQLLEPFVINDKLYITIMEISKEIYDNYEISMKIYNFENKLYLNNYISKLDCNINIDKNIAYLVTLDTNSTYARFGFGTLILKQLENHLKTYNIELLKGRLFFNTPIGLENLANFYKKNGFDVDIKNLKFRKKIINNN